MNQSSVGGVRDPSRVRLLLVTDEMEIGGTQRQIVLMAKGLDRSRFETTVAYFCKRSFLADELEAAGISVVEISKRHRLDPFFVARLAQFLRAGSFDLVHCFSFTAELWGALARRLVPTDRRPGLVTSVRNKYDWYTAWQWRLKRWTAVESSIVIANSRSGGDYAREKMGLGTDAIRVVYNGVPEAPAAALKAARSSDAGGPVTALFVGRLVEQKNVPVLLRAMSRLLRAGVALRLRIAGDGPLRQACVDQLTALGLNGVVELLGERSDAAMLMASSDFVVLPSLREGLSNVILEAMVMGRPVIASSVGGSIELVEPMRTGLLFPSDDDDALAQAMRRLVEDRALRERLGARGREVALKRFTVAALAREMQDIYLQCMPPPAQLAARRG